MANRQRSWIALAAVVLIVPGAIALSITLYDSFRPSTAVRGLRLGISPAQARQTMSSPGRFTSEAQGEDLALIWSPSGRSDLQSARLEFHLGQLVAVTLMLDPSAPEARGPPLEVTNLSVLSRERAGQVVRLRWLARTCPTHAAEVARVLGGA